MARSYESPRRVVVTGVGIVCPLGIGFDVFAANLLAGKSSITRLGSTPYSGSPHNVGGRDQGLQRHDGQERIPEKTAQKHQGDVPGDPVRRRLGFAGDREFRHRYGRRRSRPVRRRFRGQLDVQPARGSAGRVLDVRFPGRSDLFVPVRRMGRQGPKEPGALWLLRYLPNMPACHIGIYADARGPSNSSRSTRLREIWPSPRRLTSFSATWPT